MGKDRGSCPFLSLLCPFLGKDFAMKGFFCKFVVEIL